ncbi:MAG: TetR/AcrR family transcriptional regulator [Actinomycetota bacterium]
MSGRDDDRSTAPPGGSPWITDLRWAREAQQERSKRTQSALLDAVEDELETTPIKELSVADIARRAGVSTGSVYHHFANKQALLYAMLDRFHDELIVTTDDATDPARWEGAGLLDVLRGYAEFFLRRSRDGPGFTRARLQLALDDAEIAAQEEKGWVYTYDRVFQLLWARRREIGRTPKGDSIRFVLDQVAGSINARAVLPGVGRAVDTDAEFLDAIVESARQFLRIDP